MSEQAALLAIPNPWIEIEIPGEPVAQGRPQARRRRRNGGGEYIAMIDPDKSVNWKASAAWTMRAAMNGRPLLRGPVDLEVMAYFTCPKSDALKSRPRPERWHAKKPDADNVLKAVKDAGKGVLWLDDSQVARVSVMKRIAAQGEAPCVLVRVRALGDA